MKLRHLWRIIVGKTNALNPAKINFRNVWAVIQCWVRSVIPPSKYIREQIEWRRNLVKEKSPECWKSGSCVQCGCEIKGKTKADIGCENPPYCYPEMMSKDNWRVYKEKHNLC